jgi:hypothetical protein
MVPFFSPAALIVEIAGPEEAQNHSGEESPPPDSDPFSDSEF